MGYNSPLMGYAFMHLGVIFQDPPPLGGGGSRLRNLWGAFVSVIYFHLQVGYDTEHPSLKGDIS